MVAGGIDCKVMAYTVGTRGLGTVTSIDLSSLLRKTSYFR